jgi:uncharacterized coiled-coil DUF342 family protein
MSDGQRDMILELFGVINENLNTLRGEVRNDISELHQKTDKVLQQAQKTNGRVTSLESNAKECKEERKEMKKHIQQSEVRDTSPYKIGALLANVALTSGVLMSIYAIIKLF